MSADLQALVALDSLVDRQLVETLLSSSPTLRVLDYLELESAGADAGGGDVLVVACGQYTPAVGEYIAVAARARPQRPVVLLVPGSVNGHVADAFAHGAEDVLTLPREGGPESAAEQAPEMVFALEKALARRRGARTAADQRLGRLICTLGLKGGSGKTLTAANLAVALADAGRRVAIVDLDLQFGDVGLALGLTPERTLYDLVRAGGSLDSGKLADFMGAHASGVRALLAPAQPDQAGVVTAGFLGEVYPVLRESYDFTIVDTPPSFTPEVIGAVDACSDVCMVAMLDSLSLKNAKLGLQTLERMDYDSARVRIVLNRADSKVGIAPEDVVAIFGREPSVLVPSDRDITRSVNRGEPIATGDRRSQAARAFHALAAMYMADDEAPATRRRRRRLLGRG
ncbi:MAG TPA: AAA family ATPase [Solirubrobacteraceae bacterium]|nr:AAA family ATPase [Solirubrobacteraceae bacterium]